MNAILVITNLPDQAAAVKLAETLIAARAAACINILPACQSVYHWRGTVERAEEIPLLIKSTEERYPDLERIIREHHPYELPEIVCVPITRGLPEYLQWIADETR
jgi:periplasmic divalent cation tolerance protein